MATNETPSVSSTQHPNLLRAQFYLYRGIVARKHGIAVWLPNDPSDMSGPDLEQWVAFLKDAAHLPPG